jgi:hypothetical protein
VAIISILTALNDSKYNDIMFSALFRCQFTGKFFDKPQILHCGHSVDKSALPKDVEIVKCPHQDCYKLSKIADIKNNFFLGSLLEIYLKARKIVFSAKKEVIAYSVPINSTVEAYTEIFDAAVKEGADLVLIGTQILNQVYKASLSISLDDEKAERCRAFILTLFNQTPALSNVKLESGKTYFHLIIEAYNATSHLSYRSVIGYVIKHMGSILNPAIMADDKTTALRLCLSIKDVELNNIAQTVFAGMFISGYKNGTLSMLLLTENNVGNFNVIRLGLNKHLAGDELARMTYAVNLWEHVYFIGLQLESSGLLDIDMINIANQLFIAIRDSDVSTVRVLAALQNHIVMKLKARCDALSTISNTRVLITETANFAALQTLFKSLDISKWEDRQTHFSVFGGSIPSVQAQLADWEVKLGHAQSMALTLLI